VASAESCGTEGGFFLEPPANPTMLLLCPSTCAAIIDAPAGEFLAGVPCSPSATDSTTRR
jgi:hypothetical protein